MGKNILSGGGPSMSKPIKRIFTRKNKRKTPEDQNDQRGDSDEDGPGDEYEEDEGKRRVLHIFRVSEYQIHSGFKPHLAHKPHFILGKCYEYVYVDRVSPDGKTAWATMRPNYAGTYLYQSRPHTTYIRNYPSKYTPNNVRPENVEIETIRFKVEENGIKYTNYVESPSRSFEQRYKAIWFREVSCNRGIPSLQYLAYNQVSKKDKELLHELLDIPVPTFSTKPSKGGNAVEHNKRSRKNTRRKSKRNKL